MSDIDEEIRIHIEMDAERLMREQGLSAEEARRRAHVRFGGVVKYAEAGRDVRRWRWLDALLLDSRFGIRMLVKHRGLTVVGVFAMAVAIAVGATAFEVLSEALDPALPFPGGDRIVAVRFVAADSGNPKRQVIHEVAALTGQLTTIEQFGAFHNVQRNLVAAGAAPEPVEVAEISATAFAMTATPAQLGRHLLPSDEAPTAPPVLVIGHDAWQNRFGGAADVVGRTVNLGGVLRTIVGVMPQGYLFPVDHAFWVPLREEPLQYQRGQGPVLNTFGRLAPDVTKQAAQAEVVAVAQRSAASSPENTVLRPMVVDFTRDNSDLANPSIAWMFRIGQLLVGALTFVVAINLAVLVYARTVTRLAELAVRSALGASRARILAQLFIEALALSMFGAAAGLILAGYGLEVIELMSHANGGLPFWMHFELSPGAVIYAFGLAVAAALIMGVLPGLKATGVSVSSSLHELHGRGGTRLGATWTTLIVAQVAVAVAVLPAAVFTAARVVRMEMSGAGFAAESFAIAHVGVSPDAPKAEVDRLRSRRAEVIARLEAEPGVRAVTFSSGVPGFAGSETIRFEDGVQAQLAEEPEPSVVEGSVNLFEAYGARIVAGRRFAPSDLGANNVIVNRSFTAMYLPGLSPLGLRFQFAAEQNGAPPQPWFQIVGVVEDFPAFPPNLLRNGEPTIYQPVTLGELRYPLLSVGFAGAVPDGFLNRFREIGAEVDPAMQIQNARLLDRFYDEGRGAWRSLAYGITLVTASVLLLSAAGIYALMSFTIAQRTREIGIRTALGAEPRRVLVSVFGRAACQVGAGVIVGSILSGAAFAAIGLGIEHTIPLLLTVAAIMAIVGLLAAFGPARRGTRIQAIEALRADN